MLQRTRYRNIQNALLFVSVFVLGFSFYMEYVHQLHPCPLCIMQRFCAFLFALTCMLGLALSSMHRAKVITLLQCFVGLLGLYFSGRQLWLQSLPIDESTQCLPGVDMLVHYFSWDLILKSFVWGTGDCARADWRWLGISIPVWSSLYYGLMFVVSFYMYRAIAQSLKHTP